jgi:transposase-like protein
MMEAEMDNYLGYERSARSDSDNARNGYKTKKINSSYGSLVRSIQIP